MRNSPPVMVMAGGPPVIGVLPASGLAEHARLFDVLERVFEVRFVATRGDGEPLDGLLVFGPDAEPGPGTGAPPRRRTLALTGGVGRAAGVYEVHIAAADGVDQRLRNVILAAQEAWPSLDPRGEASLALGPGGPVWVHRSGPHPIDRVSARLPVLGEGQTLFEALHGPNALALVALVQFVRALGSGRSSRPRLRAAFVFDDPNLRLSRYGYISYRRLREHADAHGYHAAMAMIPLDARTWSREAVEVFRTGPQRLSLVMHGNNHSPSELMAARDFPAALALCAQSLRRIARFEARTGLRVDRVMMPPHGSWSRVTARALGALGYDALCTTQCRPPNEVAADACALPGVTPARFVDGCAVVPRLPLGLDRTGIAVRAFLGHPLVFYGHHNDVAGGLEPLAMTTAQVNAMGDVRWCSVGEIVRSNYDLSVDGDTALVRPWAGRVRVALPDGAERWTVQEPLEVAAAAGLAGWSDSRGIRRDFGELVDAPAHDAIVRLHSAWQTDLETIASPPRSVAATIRRRLGEARDQLSPIARVRSLT